MVCFAAVQVGWWGIDWCGQAKRVREGFMSFWRLLLMGLLCCLTMRESVVQVVDLVEAGWVNPTDRHELPVPDSEMPAPMEGEEAEWLAADVEEHNHCSVAVVTEPRLLTEQISFDAAHGGGASPRALLNALHRLRI